MERVEGLHVGGFLWAKLDAAYITLTYILLANTKSYVCAQIQGRLENVVYLCDREGKGRRL